MFSRNELVPDSGRFRAYYQNNPDDQAPDGMFRAKPGLMSMDARQANHVAFASSEAGFLVCGYLWNGVGGNPAETHRELKPEEITEYLKGWGDCGTTSVGHSGVGI